MMAVQAQEDASPARAPSRLRKQFTPHSPAGEVVIGYLSRQAALLSALDMAVRRDKPDAVHNMRVTVRRLRAALQSFKAVVPGPRTRQLRAELKWLGAVLGAARDAEVLSDHLHSSLAAVPTELVLGPAQARVTAHFAGPEAAARRQLLDVLDSKRYRALRADIDRLVSRPPLAPAAAQPAGKVLPKAVAKACKRTEQRIRQARRAPAGQQRDVALHETRKAAKRARYAAEAARPGLGQQNGGKAGKLAKRMKDGQSALGAHQDAVIARAAAREIGVHAHLAGENAFSFGLLHERAHHQAIAAEHQARRACRRARRQAHAAWLTNA